MRTPILGCIADDVTGATDLATNLVQGGMRVLQILGVPDRSALSLMSGFNAVVVALKTRSAPKDDAVRQSVAAVRTLQGVGIMQFYFKYCSTFDSTAVGNIGPVAEALMHQLEVSQTIFCPAFPRAGRTVYLGHLFVGEQLLCESSLRNHPLHPMKDANLTRVLAAQSTGEIGLLTYHELTDVQHITARLESLAQAGLSLVITDTCSDEHLQKLAHVLSSRPLVTGGSGLARFLPDAYRESGVLREQPFVPRSPTVAGRSLIVAGSCSAATHSQVQWMRSRCPTWEINVAAVLNDPQQEFAKTLQWAKSTDDSQPLLVYSTATPDRVAALQSEFGAERVAAGVEQFSARVSRAAVEELGIRRLILAGGETSGAIVKELGIAALDIGAEICPGVPWTETIGRDVRLALALKSGNFGEQDFFETALAMLPTN